MDTEVGLKNYKARESILKLVGLFEKHGRPEEVLFVAADYSRKMWKKVGYES